MRMVIVLALSCLMTVMSDMSVFVYNNLKKDPYVHAESSELVVFCNNKYMVSTVMVLLLSK